MPCLLGYVEVSIPGRLILFAAVNYLLINDLKEGLKITANTYSKVAPSFLYEANMLRLSAIYLEKQYLMNLEQMMESNSNPTSNSRRPSIAQSASSYSGSSSKKLIKAVESVIEAERIYTQRETNQIVTGDSSIYGSALAEFHLGYLYRTYAKELTLKGAKKDNNKRDVRKESIAKCYEASYEHYTTAYDLFEVVNHIKAMQLCKQHAGRYCKNPTEQKALEKKAEEIQQVYNEFPCKNDPEKCVYIPRT